MLVLVVESFGFLPSEGVDGEVAVVEGMLFVLLGPTGFLLGKSAGAFDSCLSFETEDSLEGAVLADGRFPKRPMLRDERIYRAVFSF